MDDRSHRSVTPNPGRKYKIDPASGKRVMSGVGRKSFNPPKVNEVEYTPAIDFLLKKIA